MEIKMQEQIEQIEEIRNLTLFHLANSALGLINGVSVFEREPEYCKHWMAFALRNLQNLATGIGDDSLGELVKRLERHLETVDQQVEKRGHYGLYTFLEPLRWALYRAKQLLHLVPDSVEAYHSRLSVSE